MHNWFLLRTKHLTSQVCSLVLEEHSTHSHDGGPPPWPMVCPPWQQHPSLSPACKLPTRPSLPLSAAWSQVFWIHPSCLPHPGTTPCSPCSFVCISTALGNTQIPRQDQQLFGGLAPLLDKRVSAPYLWTLPSSATISSAGLGKIKPCPTWITTEKVRSETAHGNKAKPGRVTELKAYLDIYGQRKRYQRQEGLEPDLSVKPWRETSTSLEHLRHEPLCTHCTASASCKTSFNNSVTGQTSSQGTAQGTTVPVNILINILINPYQYPVINQKGKEHKKECVHNRTTLLYSRN